MKRGETIIYLDYISASDNSDQEVDLVIDNSSVDTSTIGSYPLTISATDIFGNSSELEITVYITEHSLTYEEKEELVLAKAEEVLDSILNDDMSAYERVEAIWYYVRFGITYTHSDSDTDWVTRAYEGFFLKQGDCYTYQATAQVLLTQAGIENMNIYMIPTTFNHAWNLVNIGDGWYHFDAVSRVETEYIIMWTDAQAKEFSDGFYGTFNYDPSLYPDIE